MNQEVLKQILKESLEETVSALNSALSGQGLDQLKPILKRLEKNGKIPHWYEQLEDNSTLPNLDGKTVGSVIEKLLVAVLETVTYQNMDCPNLQINPAKGVDIPQLELGIKSPSENFCTSEPFYSAYERLLGSEYDSLVLLTNYQEAKKIPPLRLQIIKYRYLSKSEIADANLCLVARKHRDWLLQQNEASAKRVIQFLAYLNKSDWRGKWLSKLLENLDSTDKIDIIIQKAKEDFSRQNNRLEKANKEIIPNDDLEAIQEIQTVTPRYVGLIEAVSNWVIDFYGDAARLPNENEWRRFKSSKLDGKISMSFALQWRYNFRSIFAD